MPFIRMQNSIKYPSSHSYNSKPQGWKPCGYCVSWQVRWI